jgi:hypothetical protein
MAKPINASFSPAELAVKAVQAYHRAAALTGSLYQLRDCAGLPADVRPRFLAEIVLRALSESYVAVALTGDTSTNPEQVAAAVLFEIRRTWGDAVGDDVILRVSALRRGDLTAALSGELPNG